MIPTRYFRPEFRASYPTGSILPVVFNRVLVTCEIDQLIELIETIKLEKNIWSSGMTEIRIVVIGENQSFEVNVTCAGDN